MGEKAPPGELNDPILIGKYAHNILPSNEIILGHAANAAEQQTRGVRLCRFSCHPHPVFHPFLWSLRSTGWISIQPEATNRKDNQRYPGMEKGAATVSRTLAESCRPLLYQFFSSPRAQFCVTLMMLSAATYDVHLHLLQFVAQSFMPVPVRCIVSKQFHPLALEGICLLLLSSIPSLAFPSQSTVPCRLGRIKTSVRNSQIKIMLTVPPRRCAASVPVSRQGRSRRYIFQPPPRAVRVRQLAGCSGYVSPRGGTNSDDFSPYIKQDKVCVCVCVWQGRALLIEVMRKCC